jgi:hypothetical protein
VPNYTDAELAALSDHLTPDASGKSILLSLLADLVDARKQLEAQGPVVRAAEGLLAASVVGYESLVDTAEWSELEHAVEQMRKA